MAAAERIAIVEDDDEMGAYLVTLLKAEGYRCERYATPGRFLDSLVKQKPDLVLMDMGLPGMDGREIIRVLRLNPETKHLLIVAVSAQTNSNNILTGIQSGADDYFSNPVDAEALLVRIRNLLCRFADRTPIEEKAVEVGPLSISLEEHTCRLNGKPLALTRLEFDLLLFFLRQSDRVLTRGVLLENVWGGTPDMQTRTVDKHVETLRKKLGAFGERFETVVGIGYLFRK